MATPEITNEALFAKLEANSGLLRDIHTDFRVRLEALENTIPLDDRGQLDFLLVKGHHEDVRDDKKDMREYKRVFTSRLLNSALGLLGTILAFLLAPYATRIVELIGG